MDSESNTQLEVSNVIVQYVNMRVLDNVGRRAVDTVGSGEGYLFYQGEMLTIKWEKASETSPTKWFDENGKKLKINSGKTWICLLQNGTDLILGEEEE